jgi:hypothetical protein
VDTRGYVQSRGAGKPNNLRVFRSNDIIVPLYEVDLSIIVEITIKSTNKIKYGIAYL